MAVLRRPFLMLLGMTLSLLAGGGFIRVISTNRVSINTTDWRWEPSSSFGSTWVTSWNDITLFRAYTSAWAGTLGWYTRFHHTMNGHETGDVFLLFNAVQGRHNLALMDLESCNNPGCNIGFRKSTDASGCTWESPVLALASGDYPSVAVASNGTIVIGSHIIGFGFAVEGFQTVVSTNGGQSWNGPFTVMASGDEGFQGRVVASGNKFHAFFATTNPVDATVVLKRKESTDGANWVDAPLPLDTYTAPQRFSPPPDFCSGSGDCGRLHYATALDATAAPGVGWVVLYPLANPDNPGINSLKFCAESLVGCRLITYSTDLFLHGVTASSSGDMWVTMYSYSGAPNRTLPLVQIAGYGTPSGPFISGAINTNIDPTSWRFIPQTSRCKVGFTLLNCFSAGDYMRPAMNTFTTATLPFILQSPRKTDLKQTFVDDPQLGIPSVPGLSFGPLQPFGSDSSFKGTLSSQEIQQRKRDFVSSARFLLEAAGRVSGP